MFEDEFLDWVFHQTRGSNPRTLAGPGDDAAIVSVPEKQLFVTTDLLADGTHFELSATPLSMIGRKSLAVSLSDIAAMGGKPTSAVVQLLLPRSFTQNQARELQSGILELATRFEVDVIGGDTNRWDGRLVIGSTVTGVPGRKVWRIDGARTGDKILVSGKLGGSLLGHHLVFEPRCELATWINDRFDINAATDISDSLTIDVANIAELSGLQAEIKLATLPISESARQMAVATGRSPIDHALTDGEDFELILSCSDTTARKILGATDIPVPIVEIGQFVPGSGLRVVDEAGSVREMEPRGYVH